MASMLGIHAHTGQPITGLDHLKQSIRDILTTPIGTRVMRREYGSRIPELVDRPMTPALAAELYAAAAEALHRWEPRLRLQRVQVLDARPGHLSLQLQAQYLPDGRSVAMEVVL
ncbi:MAG: GPW/gp25 family protein [Rhodocyclaceae bacterium]|nr:GPW/gp25 family protein [Rhodocyclaceae bacterium]